MKYEYKVITISVGLFESPHESIAKFLNNPKNYEGFEFVQVLKFGVFPVILFRKIAKECLEGK